MTDEFWTQGNLIWYDYCFKIRCYYDHKIRLLYLFQYYNVEAVQDPKVDRSRSCPYLDTINRYDTIYQLTILHSICQNNEGTVPFSFVPYFSSRSVLDFDFEKLCSVSLSHINVYACLVCGKYFQGICVFIFLFDDFFLEIYHKYFYLIEYRF